MLDVFDMFSFIHSWWSDSLIPRFVGESNSQSFRIWELMKLGSWLGLVLGMPPFGPFFLLPMEEKSCLKTGSTARQSTKDMTNFVNAEIEKEVADGGLVCLLWADVDTAMRSHGNHHNTWPCQEPWPQKSKKSNYIISIYIFTLYKAWSGNAHRRVKT